MDAPAWKTLLDAEFRSLGWRLLPDQLSLVAAHAEQLERWNRATNLTRIVEPVEVARRHFVESFEAGRLFGPGAPRVLDVGAGGGFPGLAAAAVRPMSLTMLEPRERKAAFLSRIARLHAPPAPVVLRSRLEDYTPSSPHDVVTLRAVRIDLPQLLRVLVADGRLVTFSGDDADPALPAALDLLESHEFPWGGRVFAWRRR